MWSLEERLHKVQRKNKFETETPHHTVFKSKRYCFVPDTANVHTTTVRKRIVSKTLSRVERFENGTVWKRCFPCVNGENDTIWKWWRHHNSTTWLQTTQPWVSKIADRRFLVTSLLIAVIFSWLFDFSRREQDDIKLLSLAALGGTMIIKTTRSKPAKT